MTNEINFSICLPTYNRAPFLQNCIQSIVGQTYKNFELIITDNCSNDNTSEIINSFSDHRIKYYVNDKNLGLWGNHNEALRKACNNWVVFVHSDEALKPNALESMVKIIKENESKNIGVIIPINDRPAMADFIKQPFFVNIISNEYALVSCLTGIGNPSGMCFSMSTINLVEGFNLDNEVYYMADHILLAEIANKGLAFYCTSMSYVLAEEGKHQATSQINRKIIYESSVAFYNSCSNLNLFDKSIKIFLDKSNSWDKLTFRKIFFWFSTMKNKKYVCQILFSKYFVRKILFSRQGIYGLANLIFGAGFYSFLLRVNSKFGS
jgi:glycosyltransferase involved in cell wall biosynthesis